MKSRMWLLSGILSLFVLLSGTMLTNAAVVGNTYVFTMTTIDQYTRDSNGPIINTDVTAHFQVEVFNVTTSDRYEYNFNGYHPSERFPADVNDSVAFQDNKVYFVLDETDSDANNKSEIASIRIYPYWPRSPGRDLFVNPTWSTHETDWNSAISDTEDVSSVESITHSLGDGVFSFQIVVNMEGGDFVGEEFQMLNGTQTFDYSASFDEDGVLSLWSFSTRLHMQNENYTLDHTNTLTIVRGSVPGGAVINTELGTIILVSGTSFVIALVLGAYIGKNLLS